MADIRISQLPLATGPTAPAPADVVALDGATTRKAPLSALADSIRAMASQAEAEAGTNADKGMSPLTTKQSIAYEIGVTLASVAQGAKADTAMQPAIYDPTGKNVSPFVSSNIDFANPDTGGQTRSVYDILRNTPTLSSFGGTNNAALAAMAAAYGFVVFPRGDTTLNNITINVPSYYQPGARISANAGQIVTITGRINANPKQQIFTGLGSFSLTYSNPSGEDTKCVYAAWFGISPTGGTAIDQYAAIQNALNSLGNTREGIFEFDNGSFFIDNTPGPILVPRGIHLKGQGIRRTTFDLPNASGIVFATNGNAVKFSDFQFEQPVQSARTGTLIELRHTDCVVDNIRCWNTQYGIVATTVAERASITNIESIYGFALAADSATVWVQSTDSYVNDVSVCGTSFGPRDIVRVGQGHTSALDNVQVSNIRTTETSISVNVIADTNNVRCISVNGVNGFSAGAETVVKISTSGTANMEAVSVSGVVAPSGPLSLMKVVQASSGATTGISLGSSVITGSSGDGVILTVSAGTMSNVTIGNDVNFRNRGTTGLVITGDIQNLVIPSFRFGPIANDGFIQLPSPYPGRYIKVAVFDNNFLNPLPNASGEAFIRNQATNVGLKMSGGANFAAVSTTVGGTTGSAGNVTLGITSGGNVRLENRTGASISVELTYT